MSAFGVEIPVSLNDVVQIAVLYGVIYSLLKAVRGTRVGQVLTGAGALVAVLFAFTFLFHFQVLAYVVRGLLAYFAISSVVIFQQEIRRALETLGALLFQEKRERFRHARRVVTPETMADWLFALAHKRIGALVAFERGISLRGHEASGVALDALPSMELLTSIFTEPLPLHDGGVIVRDGRIAAAHCIFPVSAQESLSGSGMRHRAAVGLSEETDAFVVVVSEETGAVSLARNGSLQRHPLADEAAARDVLIRWLRVALQAQRRTPVEAALERGWRWLAKRRTFGGAEEKEKAA